MPLKITKNVKKKAIILPLKIIKNVGKKAIIKTMPNQMGDVPLTSAYQGFSKKILGFEPKWNLDKGIEETVKWYCQKKRYIY